MRKRVIDVPVDMEELAARIMERCLNRKRTKGNTAKEYFEEYYSDYPDMVKGFHEAAEEAFLFIGECFSKGVQAQPNRKGKHVH